MSYFFLINKDKRDYGYKQTDTDNIDRYQGEFKKYHIEYEYDRSDKYEYQSVLIAFL